MKILAIPGLALLLGLSTICDAKTITVASDGSGDFKAVQDAIDSVPADNAESVTIHIKPGTYAGQIIVAKGRKNLTLQGDDAQATKLTWDRNVNDPKPPGADNFNPGIQVLADDFENTSGNHGQALAMRLDGDRAVITDCRIIGWQDTLMVNNGRDYFKNCLIAGRVDFIYGSATAVFDHCEIKSRNGGHVTAASTPQDHPFGFVFMNCKLTSDPTPWSWPATNPAKPAATDKSTPMADLGRPWRPYASVIYLNCEMGAHIKPAGWDNWRNPQNEKTARYAEYNSTGPGANPDGRLPWTKQLRREEADSITIEKVLAGADGWNPLKE
jgi:pectinesterase